MDETLLYGRRVAARELTDDGAGLPDAARLGPAIVKTARGWRCERCGNSDQAQFYPNFCNCGEQPCVYCTACAAFGIVSRCDTLYTLPEPHVNPWRTTGSYLDWNGTRSQAQEAIARDLVASFHAGRDHLVWAVTGAGKTEMIFPVIDAALTAGKRVAVATPRIDVANELYPRLQAAFPTPDILLLHGKSEQVYRFAPLTVCSTHQLVRFDRAFDLLIVDELDAFPYRGNVLLERAVQRATAKGGVQLYLTATPDAKLLRRVRAKQLACSILPARYHGHPLPVPKYVAAFHWQEAIKRGGIPKALERLLVAAVKRKRKTLVFLPHIALMQQLEQNIRKKYPAWHFTSVSASDDARIEKVEAMRARAYDFLLTTTILERGVTFPSIDVVVLGSEQRVFTTSSLVQMAGRAGRKADDPTGNVWWLHAGRTQASQRALRLIQRMNAYAKRAHLLKEGA